MDREKKTVEICVRVTPAEKKELQEKADAAHLSLSRYLVKSASDRKMLQTENIAKLIYEIRKIGINVNQIAHVANDWMISHSDVAVCYVWKVTGGAAKFKEKAEKKGLRIIDLLN